MAFPIIASFSFLPDSTPLPQAFRMARFTFIAHSESVTVKAYARTERGMDCRMMGSQSSQR